MAVIGLGTDIVEIARLLKSVSKSHTLAKRVLSEKEYADYDALTKTSEVNAQSGSQADTINTNKQARFLAKRFAAKEAAVKAIGNGIGNGVSWQQIEVAHHASGQPYLEVSGHMATLFAEHGVTHSHISISDEQSYAVATVILESNK